MKLRARCNRCGKRWYQEDIPKGKDIFYLTRRGGHKCRVRTWKQLNDYLPRMRVNGRRKFNGFYIR